MAEKKRPAGGRAELNQISPSGYRHLGAVIKREMLALSVSGSETLGELVGQLTIDAYHQPLFPRWLVYKSLEELLAAGELELAPGLIVRRKRGAV